MQPLLVFYYHLSANDEEYREEDTFEEDVHRKRRRKLIPFLMGSSRLRHRRHSYSMRHAIRRNAPPSAFQASVPERARGHQARVVPAWEATTAFVDDSESMPIPHELISKTKGKEKDRLLLPDHT